MKTKNALTVMVVISIGFALISSFVATAGPLGSNHKCRGMRSELFDLETFLEIKLSTDQQTDMMEILSRHQNERESLWNSITENRKNLAAVLNAEQLDEENMRRVFQEASAIRAEMFLLREKKKVQLTSVLTPDQLEQSLHEKGRQIEARELLNWALAKLSAKDRIVIELVYLEGLTGKEAAELLGWSVANVKVRSFRSSKKLKKIISKVMQK